jgi:hypothetical protein
VHLVIDNKGVCSNNLVNDKERMPAHQGKGVTMIYINRYEGGFRWSSPNFAFFGLLCLFLFFLSTPVHSGTIKLPQTGQTLCYDSLGDIIPCLGTGQDGDILAGIAWPDPRFEIVNLACIVDNLTGLMWARDTSALGGTWPNAVPYVPTTFFACGLDGWRIPNINELQSLINAGQLDNASWLALRGFIFPFSAELPYWTSTSSADDPTVNAWVVDMVDGSALPDNKGTSYFLWPVRGTSNPSTNIPPGQIAETGQITQSVPYDDAYFAITPTLNVGVPWPDPRFTVTYCDSTGPCAIQLADCDIDPDPSNDVVTDNLTGLVWSGDANLGIIERPWAFALTYTNDLTVCGYADWRLPNSKELFSLVDRSQSDPALPVDHPFVRVKSGVLDHYWSSTTNAEIPTEAWALGMLFGGLNPALKINSAFVWPVRGGQTRPYIIAVEKLGTGQGKITAPGLTCVGKICTGEYSSYEVVTVTATANPGSVFTGWGGDACSGITESTCAITMTDDTTATATFLPEYKISVDPKSLNFKNLKKDVPSDTLTVSVTNVGVADLVLSPPVIVGDFPSVFGQTNDCPAALTSDAFCTITVTATSPDYDQKTAELQIVSNDPKKQTTIVKLKAKAKPPKIAKKPGSLNFKKVSVGVPIDITLALTNKGITDLEIPYTGVISITGDHPADFNFSPATCPTLATDESCFLTVTFTPSVADKRSAVLNIPSNDPKKQPALTVKLKGTGE